MNAAGQLPVPCSHTSHTLHLPEFICLRARLVTAEPGLFPPWCRCISACCIITDADSFDSVWTPSVSPGRRRGGVCVSGHQLICLTAQSVWGGIFLHIFHVCFVVSHGNFLALWLMESCDEVGKYFPLSWNHVSPQPTWKMRLISTSGCSSQEGGHLNTRNKPWNPILPVGRCDVTQHIKHECLHLNCSFVQEVRAHLSTFISEEGISGGGRAQRLNRPHLLFSCVSGLQSVCGM